MSFSQSPVAPNEYYCGDLPGMLQYKKDPEEIRASQLPSTDDDTCGYQIVEDHSAELKRRLTPLSQRNVDSTILLVMSKVVEVDGKRIHWVKAALRNNTTGKIALITTTNNQTNLTMYNNRSVKTVDVEWFVGHYRMIAPVMFWRELQKRI